MKISKIDPNANKPSQVKNITITENGEVTVLPDAGYVLSEVDVTTDVEQELQAKSNVTPTTTSQTVTPDSGYYGLSSVQINAIPDNYKDTTGTDVVATDVLSGKKAVNTTGIVTGTMPNNGATGTTITTQGGTYTIPAGYTSGGTVTANIAAGSTGTPTAVKGTVSNNSVSVTPSVTSSTGYIIGEAITGPTVKFRGLGGTKAGDYSLNDYRISL